MNRTRSTPRNRRRLRRVLGALGLALATAVVAGHACAPLGDRASGVHYARMKASPEWKPSFVRGQFHNPQPLHNDLVGSVAAMFHVSPFVSPSAPVSLVVPDPASFATPPPTGLRVTWLGHSTTLVEIDGHRILTDPVWSDRISPVSFVGPKRWYTPPIPFSAIPPIDAVVISHDHYDHLDYGTIVAMKDWPTTFVVPLGVGGNLAYWGVPESKIVELDWWQKTQIGSLDIVCTPARHASGREGIDQDAKLWAGYAFVGTKNRVYFSGDTGIFPAMREIGSRLGPFDLTMIEVGQYHPAWPDWHIGPEQAVRAHGLVNGRVFLPIHWGAIALAMHAWTEPVERASAAAKAAGVVITTPRPGESFEPAAALPTARWWPDVPWVTGANDPIVSTQMD